MGATILRRLAAATLAVTLAGCGGYSGNADNGSGGGGPAPTSTDDFFKSRIEPRLDFCRTCHIPGGTADTDEGQRMMLSTDKSQDWSNFEASWSRMGGNNPVSRILIMASGEENHTGGTPWPKDGDAYRDVETILKCFENPDQCDELIAGTGGGTPPVEKALLGSDHGRGTRQIFCEGENGTTPKDDSTLLPQDARELVQPGISDGKAVAFNGYWENCKINLPESDQAPKTCGEFRKLRDEGEYLLNIGLAKDLYEADGSSTVTAEAFNDSWKKWGGGLTKRPENFDLMYTLRYGKNSPHFRNPYPIRKDDGSMEDPNATNGGSGQLPIGMTLMKDEAGKWTNVILDQSANCAGCHGGQVGNPGEHPVAGAWWGIPNNNYDAIAGALDRPDLGDVANAQSLLLDTVLGFGLASGARGYNDASTGYELLAYVLSDWDSTDIVPDPAKHPPLHGHSMQDAPSWFHQGHQARKFKSGEISVNAHRMTAAAAAGPTMLSPGKGAETRAYRDYAGQRLQAFHESLRSPDWPKELSPIDTKLAEAGAIVFHTKNLWAEPGNASIPKPMGNGSCAGCHGAYSPRYAEDTKYLATPALKGMASYVVPMSIIKSETYRWEMTATDFADTWDQSWWSYPEGQPGYVDPATKDPVTELLDDSRLWAIAGLEPKGACQWSRNDTEGYLAPALHGIWLTAPYLHNGSVATIGEVLDSTKRPTMWRRKLQTIGPVTGFDQSFATGYDFQNVGWKRDELKCEDYASNPYLSCSPIQPAEGPALGTLALDLLAGEVVWAGLAHPEFYTYPDLRFINDTRRTGAGKQGHEFTDVLTDAERRAVIEYLKTL